MTDNSMRLIPVQCNGCGMRANANIRSMVLTGIMPFGDQVWVCPPRNWFVTQSVVKGAEFEGGIAPGNTFMAFLICEVCAKLGRCEMSEEN